MVRKNTKSLNPVVVIPARMKSQRLPGKPLADIAGVPMIVHVLQRVKTASIGPVIVACAEFEIAEAVRMAGGEAVLTDPALPSGTDRIKAAVDLIDPDGKYDCVINVQGDLPLLAPDSINTVLDVLKIVPTCDIATLAVIMADRDEIANPNIVKVRISLETPNRGQALDFKRSTIFSAGHPIYHHIGLYAFRRAALDRFCGLPPSPREKREHLEQLRAMEAGIRIDVGLVDNAPLGVDTPDALEHARIIMAGTDNG